MVSAQHSPAALHQSLRAAPSFGMAAGSLGHTGFLAILANNGGLHTVELENGTSVPLAAPRPAAPRSLMPGALQVTGAWARGGRLFCRVRRADGQGEPGDLGPVAALRCHHRTIQVRSDLAYIHPIRL